MRRVVVAVALTLLASSAVFADVSLVEKRGVAKAAKLAAKAAGKAVARSPRVKGKGVTNATGSLGLVDNEGLQFFINTNITFSTTSSASAAASEASYTQAVAADTLNGGTTSSTLNDAYDGYQTMCLSLDNTVANCETGNANFVIYDRNGASPTMECLGATSGVNRQAVFPVQTAGNINMFRKVFVPDNDHFARWLNYFTNTGATPQTITMMVANNLGSDSATVITGTSAGGTTADATDLWITSFQNWSGTTSSDVRNGHVIQGPNASAPVAGLHFVNGDDNPFWGYTFTLAPGATQIIMNFGIGEATIAASMSQSANIAGLPSSATQCMTNDELREVANFAAALPIAEVPTLSRTGAVALVVLLAGAAAFSLRRQSGGAAREIR